MLRSLTSLSYRSLLNRRVSAALSIVSIALSVMLLLGVERLRVGARESFRSTISGADLIVGARSGPVQLLLYSVFRIGSPTNNLSWKSYQELANHPEVAWSIPLSLGDSHKGFRVVGTTTDYFKHYKYSASRALHFSVGRPFESLSEVVLGSIVAEKLHYTIGDDIVLSHGLSEAALRKHDDKPFKVVGVLQATGTPIDRSLHVSLEGVEVIHTGWGLPPEMTDQETSTEQDLTPKTITAFIVGLKSKIGIFSFQREVNDYQSEALTGLLPGIVLDELWQTVGLAEAALRAVSGFVLLSGLFGMLAAIYSTLNERRREMAILRACGARPFHVFSLLVIESSVLAAAGALLGFVALQGVILASHPLLETQYGLFINLGLPNKTESMILGAVLLLGALIGALPAWRAYSHSVADGLTVRV